MAILDRQNGTVVIRIVYDGKPFSGKTTSLRALAGTLARPLVSPGELEGRTLLFDWLDYTAGRFEGFQIRCQVVSVPGQKTLAARRRRLLAKADAVVLVADTTEAGMGETLEQAEGLLKLLRGLPGPPVGAIFQANKRDLPGAVPIDTLRRLVDSRGLALIESVATEGSGIRESFVFAVRLALDRVREMAQEGSLPEGRPEVDSAEELLKELRQGEEGGGMAAESLREVLAGAPPTEEEDVLERGEAPVLGSRFQLAPSGMIWPPVEGRIFLRQAFSEPVLLGPAEGGGWEARIGDFWRVHSAPQAVYSDPESGRQDLVDWARLHAASTPWLSPARCLVLAPAMKGTALRLWQTVRAERTCLDLLREALAAASAEEQAERLLTATHLFLKGVSRLRSAELPLPCTLETLGVFESQPVFVGLMPFPLAEDVGLDSEEGDPEVLLSRQLEPELRRAHASQPLAVPSILEGLNRAAAADPGLRDTAQELGHLLARL